MPSFDPPSVNGLPLPGEPLMPLLRGRVRKLAMTGAAPSADPAARIADVLQEWSALNRTWFARLLPPAAIDSDAPIDDEPLGGDLPDLDPRAASGERLQDIWEAVVETAVARGRGLIGAGNLAEGVEGLMGDLYIVAARKWPAFQHRDEEQTVRWLVSILRNLICRAVRRGHTSREAATGDFGGMFAADAVGSQVTLSRAEERELMAGRLLMLHGLFPAECRLPDLVERMAGRSTLELFVAADSLEIVLGLGAGEARLWGLLALRQKQDADAVARLLGIELNTMNVRFFRVRAAAIEVLARTWAAQPGT